MITPYLVSPVDYTGQYEISKIHARLEIWLDVIGTMAPRLKAENKLWLTLLGLYTEYPPRPAQKRAFQILKRHLQDFDAPFLILNSVPNHAVVFHFDRLYHGELFGTLQETIELISTCGNLGSLIKCLQTQTPAYDYDTAKYLSSRPDKRMCLYYLEMYQDQVLADGPALLERALPYNILATRWLVQHVPIFPTKTAQTCLDWCLDHRSTFHLKLLMRHPSFIAVFARTFSKYLQQHPIDRSYYLVLRMILLWRYPIQSNKVYISLQVRGYVGLIKLLLQNYTVTTPYSCWTSAMRLRYDHEVYYKLVKCLVYAGYAPPKDFMAIVRRQRDYAPLVTSTSGFCENLTHMDEEARVMYGRISS